MFHDIPESVQERMGILERADTADRADGTPRMERLRQVPPETGRFISILAATAPAGAMLEVGTSAGYSALWLALACQATQQTLTTFEILPEKAQLARETFRFAGVEHLVEFVEGDALDRLADLSDVAFCFLDAEKGVYADCYEAVVPNLVRGGLLVADNAINHRETLQPMIDRALDDPRVDSLVVPIGKGELVCRKL
ncbi:MAG: O-methyltransferase [Actinomycetota bacterium]|nr:O-methyltransferase [Actinomycetota bacterium]